MNDLELATMQTAFELHFDCDWNDPALRNERLAWIAAWKAARLAR